MDMHFTCLFNALKLLKGDQLLKKKQQQQNKTKEHCVVDQILICDLLILSSLIYR